MEGTTHPKPTPSLIGTLGLYCSSKIPDPENWIAYPEQDALRHLWEEHDNPSAGKKLEYVCYHRGKLARLVYRV